MEPADELVVISDLHISEGRLDDCDAELEGHLVAFVGWLAGRGHGVELVINGDFLDFVQASPWTGADLEDRTQDGVPLCFTQRQSRDKLKAIAAAHPGVFKALRSFLDARIDHRITILPGNHDADFYWKEVRDDFHALVGSPERCRYFLDPAYVPDGYPWLWIEHGQQADPVNRFEARGAECWSEGRPPILRSRLGEDRLYECTGTRFLIKFMNALDAKYPFIDNVKPFSRFIRIFGTSAVTPGLGSIKAALAVGSMLRYLADLGLHHRGDVMALEDGTGNAVEHPLAAWYRRAAPVKRKEFAARLRDAGFERDMPIEMLFQKPAEFDRLKSFLGERLELIEDLGEADESLLGKREGTLTLKGGFNADETEDLATHASFIAAAQPVTTVVMGHTHEPVNRVGTHTYFNTGSWTRYYRFDQAEKTQPWKLLSEQSYERFPYRLLYARASRSTGGATLETWKERNK